MNCAEHGEVEPYLHPDGTRLCRACGAARMRRHRASNPLSEERKAKRREYMRLHRAGNPRRTKDIALRAKFNIEVACFDAMLAAQGGGCAICHTDQPGGKGGFHVDHDRSCCPDKKSCGACVRGLLCTRCNAGIAMFNDDLGVIDAAVKYLARFQ